MKLMAFLIATMAAMAVPALTDELRDQPGYVDFSELDAAYGEPMVQVNIGPSLLGWAAALDDDPDTRFLEKLESIRVNIYRVNGDASVAREQIDAAARQLEGDGWELLGTVRSDDDQLRVYGRMNGKVSNGLVIMAAGDDDEAVFVNIIGEIAPEHLHEITDELDLDLKGI